MKPVTLISFAIGLGIIGYLVWDAVQTYRNTQQTTQPLTAGSAAILAGGVQTQAVTQQPVSVIAGNLGLGTNGEYVKPATPSRNNNLNQSNR